MIDITQTAEARRLEALCNEAFDRYTVAAEAAEKAWIAAGRPDPKGGGFFDPSAKSHQDYIEAMRVKEAAYVAHQRAASKHGHHVTGII